MKLALVPVRSGSIEDYCSARAAADKKGVSLRAVYVAIESERLVGYEVYGQTVLKVADVTAWEPRKNARRATAKTAATETEKAPAQ